MPEPDPVKKNPVNGNLSFQPGYSLYPEEPKKFRTTYQQPDTIGEETLEKTSAASVSPEIAQAVNLSTTGLKKFVVSTMLVVAAMGGIVLFLGLRQSPAPQVSQESSQAGISINPSVTSLDINRDTTISQGKKLTATGQVKMQNLVNSAQAFSVQDASGISLINVDTNARTISLGQPGDTVTLQIAGNVNINGNLLLNNKDSIGPNGLVLNSLVVCTSAGCKPNTTTTDAVTLQGQPASYFTDASNIKSGTLSDNRLSTNVALLNANQTFTGVNTFSQGANAACTSAQVLSQVTVQGGLVTGGSCSSGTGTLQQIYDASTPATIKLSSTQGGVILQDASTPLGADLFDVTDSSGATKYLSVKSSGATIGGNLSINDTGSYAINFNGNGEAGNDTGFGHADGTIYVIANGSRVATFTSGLGLGADPGGYMLHTYGRAYFDGASNSTTAFQIQNAGGTSNLFVADTTNNRIAIDQAAANYPLDVNGDINTTGTYRVNGTQIASSNLSDSSNLAKLNASQTFTGNNTFTGTVLAKNTLDSTTAFQVQSASGNPVLGADTVNRFVGIGTSGPQATLDVRMTSPSFYDGFETGALSPFTVTGGGWSALASNAHSGTYSAGGTNVDGGTLTLTKTLTSAGTISFWLEASQEATKSVTFKVDGTTDLNLSWTSVPYTYYSYGVGAGTHTFTWSFTNTSSLSNAYLDDVTVTNAGTGSAALFNGGDVGIGTYFPSSTLDVYGTSHFQAASGSDSNSLFQVQNSAGGSLLNVDSTFGGSISLLSQNSGSLATWQSTTSLPAARSESGVAVANGYVYVVGGCDCSFTTNTVYYSKINSDGTLGSWINSPDTLPTYMSRNDAIHIGNYLYAIDPPNDASYYTRLNSDGSIGSWRSTTPIPSGRGYTGYAYQNGYIYVVGGWNGTSTVNDIYYTKVNADGTLGAWVDSPSTMPQTRYKAGAAIANGYMYVLGGQQTLNGTNTTSVWYAPINADGSIGSWTVSTNSLPAAAGDFPQSTFALNGYLYTVVYGGGTYYAKLNADGSTGAWQTDTTVPPSRSIPAVTQANGYIYMLGGGPGAYNNVYYTSSARTAVGGSLDLVGVSGNSLAANNGGGELTAGNTTVVGQLNVKNQANFSSSLNVGGNLSVGGQAVFQIATDSASAFQVQNSGGASLLTADTTNNLISIGGIGAPTGVKFYADANTGGALSGSASTTYYYKITAVNALGEATPSAEISWPGNWFPAISAPAAPTGVAAAGTTMGVGNYLYKLTVVTANGETTAGTESATITTTSGNQNVTLTLPAVPTGATGFKVYRTAVGGATGTETLVTAGGCSGTISTATCTDSATDAQLSGAQPASNTATTNLNQMTINWTAVNGATSYRIYRGTAVGAENVYYTSATNSFTDTGGASTAGSPGNIDATARLGVGTTTPTANLDVAGTALFQNKVDSTSAFQVQNSSGTKVLGVDASNQRVSVGSIGTTTGQLYVSGLLPTAAIGSAATGDAQQVAVQGHYAYAIDYTSATMQVIDITNPSSPTVIYSGNPGSAITAGGDIAVSGKYAYIGNENGGTNIAIIDISNPSAPSLAATVNSDADPHWIDISGRYMFVSTFGGKSLEMYDLAKPTAPVLRSTVSVGGNTHAVAVSGWYAYVTDYSNSLLKIYDFSNPTPTLVNGTGTATGTNPRGIAISGRYAYLVNYGSATMEVLDISNPALPSVVATVATGTNPVGVVVQGRYAYVTSSGSNTLQAFDISNPASPTSIGTVTTNAAPWILTVSGRYAYVPTANAVQIFDLGGTYSQQLEAGGAEVGSLQIDNSGQVNGDFNVQGALNVGQSLQVANNIGTAANLFVQGSYSLAGGFLGGTTINGLSVPGAPTVTSVGANADAATWTYQIAAVAANGGVSAAGAAGSVSAADNATLSSTNYNSIAWSPVNGAVAYRVYRTAVGTSPATTGLIATVSTTELNDTGLAGDGTTPPTNDTSGSLRVLGYSLFKNSVNSNSSFQVQDASGTVQLNVNTTSGQVTVGNDTVSGSVAKFNVLGGLYDPVNGYKFNLKVDDTTAAAQGVGGGIGFGGQADTDRTFAVVQGYHESATATDYSGALGFFTRPSGSSTIDKVMNLSSTGAALFENSSNSSTAFQIQQASAGTVLLNADTSSLIIKVAGTATTFATLQVDNGHFESTQTTAPTIGMTTCVGTPAVTAGSTDAAGSIDTGTLTTGGACVITVTFNNAYGTAPKSVIITPKNAAAAGATPQAYVSSTGTTTFVITFVGSVGTGANYQYYYWVIE